MSYRRSIHCRHCGESGHNRNGCAKLKEYIKNNPNSYSAEREKARLENMKHRKCSYCNTEGHNRKTCSHIMSDMITVAGVNQDFRRKFYQNIVKGKGIAPGALVSVDNTSGYDQEGIYRYDLKDKMALVTEISFDDVKCPNKDGVCSVVKVQFLDLYNYRGQGLAEIYLSVPNWFVLGKEPPADRWYRNSVAFKVVSPGHYELENEDAWVKNKESIEQICQEYGNHTDLKYAIEYLNK